MPSEKSQEQFWDVSTKNIGVTDRMNRNLTWLEHVIQTYNCYTGLCANRFSQCFEFLVEDGLPATKVKYEEGTITTFMEFDYYDQENYYFLTEDGNHRTIFAKIIGVEQIRVRHVNSYHFNETQFILVKKMEEALARYYELFNNRTRDASRRRCGYYTTSKSS
ncbi:MAG: hypothetical protein ACRC6X_04835 [Culicoidibacterales bacterium]